MRAELGRRVHVACLCAAWCQVCAGYEGVLAEARQSGWSIRSIDIEDESELIADWEITQFPTLLVFDAERIYFAGPLRPDASTLLRVLADCERRASDQAAASEAPQATLGLARRLLTSEQ